MPYQTRPHRLPAIGQFDEALARLPIVWKPDTTNDGYCEVEIPKGWSFDINTYGLSSIHDEFGFEVAGVHWPDRRIWSRPSPRRVEKQPTEGARQIIETWDQAYAAIDALRSERLDTDTVSVRGLELEGEIEAANTLALSLSAHRTSNARVFLRDQLMARGEELLQQPETDGVSIAEVVLGDPSGLSQQQLYSWRLAAGAMVEVSERSAIPISQALTPGKGNLSSEATAALRVGVGKAQESLGISRELPVVAELY